MNADYFEEVHKLSYTDEYRYKLLIQGTRRILKEKKKVGIIQKMKHKWITNKKEIKAGTWK
ncbi:hypothetical protein ACP8HI_02490 [Paenibacillus sp. FA6]|uniref:hypothetical protein n=1 Tax=Paenibacillus sp. FA6 TaxID=3413029 RepID=UPI003F65AA98